MPSRSSVYLSARLPVCLSACLSVYLSASRALAEFCGGANPATSLLLRASICGRCRRFLMTSAPPPIICRRAADATLVCLFRGHPFMTSTRRGEGVGLRWTHVDGGRGGPAPCGPPHRKLKLEFTDVILSSSHAKKLTSFLPEFRLLTEKKWKFFCDIN